MESNEEEIGDEEAGAGGTVDEDASVCGTYEAKAEGVFPWTPSETAGTGAEVPGPGTGDFMALGLLETSAGRNPWR